MKVFEAIMLQTSGCTINKTVLNCIFFLVLHLLPIVKTLPFFYEMNK